MHSLDLEYPKIYLLNLKHMRSSNKTFIRIFKLFFEILIFILFVGSYFKILSSLQSNIPIKLIFSIIYLWFTVGMNVNFILPLLKIIDNKIKNL